MPDQHTSADPVTGMLEGVQSLVVAFVLAMTFRGFVVEGFVIPTGSMAPTLRGQHLVKHSDQVGQDFPVGFDAARPINVQRLVDPMVGRTQPLPPAEQRRLDPRGGDRVLILKTIYPFFGPDRFDVVVFKNPTDTQGPSSNYIKRLIGLPGETIWLADGDVFAGDDAQSMHIQRKPNHVQRGVWQPVHDSDATPLDPSSLQRPWHGPPWVGRDGDDWSFSDRSWHHGGRGHAELAWDSSRLPLDDWLSYNMLMPSVQAEAVSDVRVSATIVPGAAGLDAALELESRGHLMRWSLGNGTATVSMRPLSGGEGVTASGELDPLPPGQPVRVECWHADQSLQLFVDGALVAVVHYGWGPEERLRWATGSAFAVAIEQVVGRATTRPRLRWVFDGAPLTLHRLRLDRDLHYRGGRLPSRATRNPTTAGNEALVALGSPGFATHPSKLGVLGEDQFLMLGDNSAYSLDGRLWGNPDPYVAAQIDSAPFVVDRRLLIGKAWSVYWPSAHSAWGIRVVPNFGQMRFVH